jgi:hypothetical protein
MNREEFLALGEQEQIDYLNGKLASGEDWDAILAEIGIERKEVGQSKPYGLGLIKIGKEVKPKPGKGDNGFAW